MQRNFILTDVMKTGYHGDLEQFISMNSLPDQHFDMTGDYYKLHRYEISSYDRRLAIVDVRHANHVYDNNDDFNNELARRINILRQKDFKFIMATPWESIENIKKGPSLWPKKEQIGESIIWSGSTSWFWFYMFRKHKEHTFKFTHDHSGSYWYKPYDFLYLNKAIRPHRIKLYERLLAENVLQNSLHTFTDKKTPRHLDVKYELPGIDPGQYPRFGKDQDIYEPPYNDTVCSIVSETNDNNDEVFITEKIWKPIIAQHIFVVHGNQFYLKRLREIGFITFSDFFDESYDLETDPNSRIEKIVLLCKELKLNCDIGNDVHRGNKKWQKIYQQTEAIRKHNYDTFFNQKKLSAEINKTIGLFLKFADTGQISS